MDLIYFYAYSSIAYKELFETNLVTNIKAY